MHIVLVHGFNVRDGGKRTIDKLAKHLQGYGHTVDTDTADYGLHGLIKVRFFNGQAVRRIRGALVLADAVITHSNGANYTTKALKTLTHKVKVFHLSPALNKKKKVPAAVSVMHVFHTGHDKAVKAAKYLIAHPWGNMGRVGYKGKDKRVTNHDHTDRVPAHSDWFTNANAAYFASKINRLLRA